jgi:hypothetical protein
LIRVDAGLFRAAGLCRSFEETRYYLNGVYVQSHPEKGVLLTATDGHRLVCIHDLDGECSSAQIINIDAKAVSEQAISSYRKQIAGSNPKVIPKVDIVIDDDGIATVGTYRSLKSCIIDGTYPDWTVILKPVRNGVLEQKHAPASFNNRYLHEFGKVAAALSPDGNKDVAIRVVSFNEHDPALIRFSTMDHAFGILMPMRSGSSNELPIWMKPILEPAPVSAPPEVAASSSITNLRAKATKRPAARRAVKKRKRAKIAKKAAKRRAA